MGTWVLIRLPSAITEIVSSANVPGYSGFYFRFKDSFIARKWEEGLLCFRRIRGSKTDLYVVRDISEREMFGPWRYK
ncbi:putative PH domain-containing protein [Seiridium cardinale]